MGCFHFGIQHFFCAFKNWHHIFEPEHVDFKAGVFSPHTVFFWTPHFISSTRDGWTLAAYKFSVTHYGLVSITWDFFWFRKLAVWTKLTFRQLRTLRLHVMVVSKFPGYRKQINLVCSDFYQDYVLPTCALCNQILFCVFYYMWGLNSKRTD